MGRAIVRHPQAFLMDEPLSNLDAKLRVQMRSEIARIQHDLGVTTIYVTHDQTEAMTMGDRVAVIRKGELQQVDTPQALYEHPVNLFVAGFIGSPAMNLFDATLVGDGDGAGASSSAASGCPVPAEVARRPDPPCSGFAGRVVVLGIRPEDMEDASLVSDAPTERRITVHRRAARGARAPTSSCTSASTPRQPMTDDMRELASDVGAEALEHVEQQARRRPHDVAGPPQPALDGGQGRTDRAGGRHPAACTSSTPTTTPAIYGDAADTTPTRRQPDESPKDSLMPLCRPRARRRGVRRR